MMMGLSLADLRAMTLTEFSAAAAAFSEMHGGKPKVTRREARAMRAELGW